MRDGNAKRSARKKGKRTKRPAVGGNGARPAAPAPPAPSGPVGAGSTAPSRRQRLIVRRIDIRSIFKLSIIFYASLACVVLVAAMLLWAVATVTGVRSNVEQFIGDLVVAEDFRLVGTKMLELGGVLGLALVVLGTAANLVMAILYNLISDVVGGLSVVVEGSRVSGGPSGSIDGAEADGRPTRRPEAVPRGR